MNTRVRFYRDFISGQPGLVEATIDEGRKSNEQKAAEAAAAAQKAAEREKFNAEIKVAETKYHNEYAPAHAAQFKEHLHNELSKSGFNKAHDGPKKSIYTKMDPKHELLHVVTVRKPSGKEDLDRHSHSVTYSRGSSSYGTESYEPSFSAMHWADQNPDREKNNMNRITDIIKKRASEEPSWHD